MPNILTLLGPVLFGVAVAGALLFFKRVLRVPLPASAIPSLAALSMIGAHVYNEYTWFDRFEEKLPEAFVVADTRTTSAFYEPWTYLWPRIDGFLAIDGAAVRTNPAQPEMIMAEILIFRRYSPTARVIEVADCAGNRTADLPPDAEIDGTGMPTDVTWFERPADHPVLSTMCGLLKSRNSV